MNQSNVITKRLADPPHLDTHTLGSAIDGDFCYLADRKDPALLIKLGEDAVGNVLVRVFFDTGGQCYTTAFEAHTLIRYPEVNIQWRP